MNPNPNQSTNFNGVGNKPVIFPATRFYADKDDKGVVKVDEHGDAKSGVLEVKLYEATKDGSSREIASFEQPMSFAKYKAVREDIDVLTAEKIKEYFPALKEGNTKAQQKEDKKALEDQDQNKIASDMRESKIASMEAQINELKSALAQALDLAAQVKDNQQVKQVAEPQNPEQTRPNQPEQLNPGQAEQPMNPDKASSTKEQETVSPSNSVERNVVPVTDKKKDEPVQPSDMSGEMSAKEVAAETSAKKSQEVKKAQDAAEKTTKKEAKK